MTTRKTYKTKTRAMPSSVYARQQREKAIASVDIGKLSSVEKAVFEKNHDIGQVFLMRQKDTSRKFTVYSDPFRSTDRYIVDLNSAPRAPYKERKDEPKTVLHDGQRKLLVMETEFLTKYSQDGDIVIYAGAAPATHQEEIARRFPNIHFMLYDPRPINISLTDKQTVYKEYFTTMTAQFLSYKYRHQRLLFISDIRRDLGSKLTNKQKEKIVVEDMENQRLWVKILRPAASLLKFRLPYEKGITKYLDGMLYIQPFVGATSTETRLVVIDPDSSKEYDNRIYEEVLFYHNTQRRTGIYLSSDNGADMKGYLSYDYASQAYIEEEYRKKYSKK